MADADFGAGNQYEGIGDSLLCMIIPGIAKRYAASIEDLQSATVSVRLSQEENHMFLHLPIVLVASLLPVADKVPEFDIARECRFENETTPQGFERCSTEEANARQKLQEDWTKFAATDKHNCMVETTIGGFVSYVELLTCLQIANDVITSTLTPGVPPTGKDAKPTGREPPETTVGEGRHPK